MSALAARRLRLRRRRLRVTPLAVLILAALLAVLAAGWLWFRDSSLVAVRRVQITGVSGPQVGSIEQALRSAALTMTTLDVNLGRLRTAVRPYPEVKALSVSTQFPHGIMIRVSEQIPVAAVITAGHAIAVSADDTLLPGTATAGLPQISLQVPPGGSDLTSAGARAAVAVLAAAPYALLPHIAQAADTGQHGVVVQLRNGPAVYFGDTSQLAAKWGAAVAVLGSGGSRGAQYIDVSDPQRPAAGANTASGSGSGGTATTSSATTTTTGSAAP